jgi:uncharacterized protein with HEPN domain
MSNEFLDFVEHILDAMDEAGKFVAGMTYSEFEADAKTNYAVVRALEIIGEATKRLPMEVRESYPLVPWKGMAGMRDRVIHGYEIVNLRTVWEVVKNDIPQIRPHIVKILMDYEE